MKRKRISEVLHEVDPNLKIIEGGVRYRRRLTSKDWDKTVGVVCLKCGRETLRIRDGICLQCYREKEEERERKQEDKAERRYWRDALRRGTVSLAQLRDGRL